MIERARGNWEAGETAFERGLALARELDAPVEATRTLLEYGLLLAEAGRVEEGRARLREAEEQATRIGLRPVAQAAREALRATMSA
jgi:C4-dicarboxylate-specific signal transduction histidine kinase